MEPDNRVAAPQIAFRKGRWRARAIYGDLRIAGCRRRGLKAIRRVLHQGVLEQIGRMRRRALPEQQISRDETVERRSQFRVRLAPHRSQQGVRKLPGDRREQTLVERQK